MTREQQLEVKRIIKGRGGTIDEDGWISQDTTIYTHTIDALREQEARIYYVPDRHQIRISDWNLELMEELEEPKESSTRMKVNPFKKDNRMELVKRKDFGHDHIHVYCDGSDLGFMHIGSKKIYWWPTCGRRQALDLQKDC